MEEIDYSGSADEQSEEGNVTDSIDIDDLTYQELQLECKKQGLSQGGNASTLRKS